MLTHIHTTTDIHIHTHIHTDIHTHTDIQTHGTTAHGQGSHPILDFGIERRQGSEDADPIRIGGDKGHRTPLHGP